MTRNNALITNSMLALYVSKQNKTYLQMIEPFILYSIPNSINKKIDIEKVRQKVSKEFGLNINYKVVERVLLNLSKVKKNRKITSKKDNNKFYFYVSKSIDNSEFDKNRQLMKELVSEVVNLFKNFYNENNFGKINDKQAEDMLINYLNEYNFKTYKNIDIIEKIQLEESISSNNYKVAKFIFNVYKNDKFNFNKILTMQEGYFALKALYNFFESNSTDDNVNNTLNDSYIIMDTMLLIDAFKWDTDYKARSMEELLKLIIENGGKLCTFDFYVEELCGILHRYINDYDSRIFLDLDYFRKNNIDSSKIVEEEYKLEKMLNGKKSLEPIKGVTIEIFYFDSYEKNLSETKQKIFKDNIEREIKFNIKYANNISLDNDCNSIQIALYERTNNRKDFIFMSSNNHLISVAKNITDTKNKNAFYTDIDLASMIWLSNYNSNTNLSECTLLQNAYAALLPSKEFLKEVVNHIEKNMNSTDEQLKKEALLLRYDKDLLTRISKVYQNDQKNLKMKTHEDLMNQLRREITNELSLDIESKVRNEHKIENKKLKEKEYKNLQMKKSINNKEKEIIKKEKKVRKELKYLEEIQNTIDERDKEIESIQIQIKELLEIEKSKCKKYSLFFEKLIKTTFILLCGIVLFLCLRAWLDVTLKNIIPNNLINNIVQISNLLAFIFTLISIIPIYLGYIKKISIKTEEFIYQFLCNHSKILRHKND